MVGAAMAMDLAAEADLEVTVADRDADRLQTLAARFGVATVQADLGDPDRLRKLAGQADVILGALSSVIGLQSLQAVLEAGRDYVDISFMPEDPTTLHALAQERGACAVVDCGVAPGLSNMLCGFAAASMQPCEKLRIFVGGLPAERSWPYEYRAGFAPSDVIEEYVRPARQVENGKVVVYPALSGVERLEFPDLGTLEAFHTDGLRSLIQSLEVPDMQEKTMRYPGHAALMESFRETGLFSPKEIQLPSGDKVTPLEMTSTLMFPKWEFQPGEVDITVLRVQAQGVSQGRQIQWQWDLHDRMDPTTGFRSMSRTTAFPATAMARLLLSKKWHRPGVHPPEIPAQETGVMEEILTALKARGISIRKQEQTLE